MSNFSWRHGVTAGLALIIAFATGGYILGNQLGQEVGKKDAHTKKYERHAANEIERTCLRLDPAAEAECVVRVINSAHEHKRAESDLIAQRNMARWALLMLLATVAMAFITAAGVYYVWRTLKATQVMAGDTRRIGEAQVRAYVSISSFKVSLVIEDEMVRWSGVAKLSNAGQSPAILASIIVEGAGFLSTSYSGQKDIPTGGCETFFSTNMCDRVDLVKHPLNPEIIVCAGTITIHYQDVFSKGGTFYEELFCFSGEFDPSRSDPVEMIHAMIRAD